MPKRGVLARLARFLAEIGRRFNPRAYEEFSEYKLKHSLAFLAKLLAAAIVLEFILFIPILARLPAVVDATLDKFYVLEIKPNISIAEPIIFKFGKTELVIDSENATAPERGILVTPHKIVKSSWRGIEERNLTGLSNVLANRQSYKSVLWGLLVLVLPGALVLSYLSSFIVTLLFSAAIAFIALIVVRLIRFEINYKHILNMTLATFTAPILIDALTEPFVLQFPWLIWMQLAGYALMLFYIVFGIRSVGFFERERKFVRRKPGSFEY